MGSSWRLSLLLLLTAVLATSGQLLQLPRDINFSCRGRLAGFYADPQYDCQVFHICLRGRKQASMLCPAGTSFSQQQFTCTWQVDASCSTATQNYGLNEKLYFQDMDPAIRAELIGGRGNVEFVPEPRSQPPTRSFRAGSSQLAATRDSIEDGGKQLFEGELEKNLGNDLSDFSAEETDDLSSPPSNHIAQPPLLFSPPFIKDNVLSPPLEFSLPVVNIIDDNILPEAQNIREISDYLPPNDLPAPPTSDYLPPNDLPAPPTSDYLPPNDLPAPPTSDYLPPNDLPAPPTSDYLPPINDDSPPTNDYLPPINEFLPSDEGTTL